MLCIMSLHFFSSFFCKSAILLRVLRWPVWNKSRRSSTDMKCYLVRSQTWIIMLNVCMCCGQIISNPCVLISCFASRANQKAEIRAINHVNSVLQYLFWKIWVISSLTTPFYFFYIIWRNYVSFYFLVFIYFQQFHHKVCIYQRVNWNLLVFLQKHNKCSLVEG